MPDRNEPPGGGGVRLAIVGRIGIGAQHAELFNDITESDPWKSGIRNLILSDTTSGERLVELQIPDSILTPRVVELLREIIAEVEREQRDGPLVKIESRTADLTFEAGGLNDERSGEPDLK